MKPIVLIASLVFGAMGWCCFAALLVKGGLTPAQAIAVIVIVAGLTVLVCFRLMDRASE